MPNNLQKNNFDLGETVHPFFEMKDYLSEWSASKLGTLTLLQLRCFLPLPSKALEASAGFFLGGSIQKEVDGTSFSMAFLWVFYGISIFYRISMDFR